MDPLSDQGFVDSVRAQMGMGNPDAALAVRFYTDEVQDAAETEKAGYPVFRTVECCEIVVPGDKGNIVRGRVKSMHPDPRERFPQAYAKFKAGKQTQQTGLPLKEWGMLPRTRALTWEALGCHTVEQLAAMAETNAREVQGGLTDRKLAQDFLATAKGMAPLAEARAEADKLRAELEATKDVLAELTAQVAELKRGAAAAPAPSEAQQALPQATPPTIRRKAG